MYTVMHWGHDLKSQIDVVEAWVGSKLPKDYREYLMSCEVEESIGDVVLLYGLDLLIERNENYETKKYCPGFITIGNDSGDMEIILSLQDGTIFMMDGGSMCMDASEFVAENFHGWCEGGFLLPEEEWPDSPATERVFIYLNRKPATMKLLLKIKEQLGLITSMSKLKDISEKTPCMLTESFSYIQAIRKCDIINQIDNCLSIRDPKNESMELPMEWIENDA